MSTLRQSLWEQPSHTLSSTQTTQTACSVQSLTLWGEAWDSVFLTSPGQHDAAGLWTTVSSQVLASGRRAMPQGTHSGLGEQGRQPSPRPLIGQGSPSGINLSLMWRHPPEPGRHLGSRPLLSLNCRQNELLPEARGCKGSISCAQGASSKASSTQARTATGLSRQIKRRERRCGKGGLTEWALIAPPTSLRLHGKGTKSSPSERHVPGEWKDQEVSLVPGFRGKGTTTPLLQEESSGAEDHMGTLPHTEWNRLTLNGHKAEKTFLQRGHTNGQQRMKGRTTSHPLTESNKCWRGCGEPGACEPLVGRSSWAPARKTVPRFLEKLKTQLP